MSSEHSLVVIQRVLHLRDDGEETGRSSVGLEKGKRTEKGRRANEKISASSSLLPKKEVLDEKKGVGGWIATHEKNNNNSDHSLSESRVVEGLQLLVVETRPRCSSGSGFDSRSDGDDEDGR